MDTEIKLLRQRLAYLEQQQILELQKEIEKKARAIQVVENFINEKKQRIQQNRYSRYVPLAAYYDSKKVAFLKPILHTLKDLQTCIEALKKQRITV